MRWLSPHEQRLLRRRRLSVWLFVLVLMLLASVYDRALWQWSIVDGEAFHRLRNEDWYQCFRQVGYLPLWGCIGAMVMAADFSARRPRWAARGVLIFLAAALGGLFAEAILGGLMRQRPGTDGFYWFSWLNEGLARGPGHGFPSSHVAVAFGAAWMIRRIWPGSGVVSVALAAGCAWTRMLAGAHFATDVMGGAIVGWLATALLWRIHLRASLAANGPSRPRIPYACD